MGVWWEAAGGAGNSYKFCKEFAADGGNVFLLLNWAHDKLWLGWCSFFSLWLSGVVPPVKVNDPFSLGLPASGATWPKDQGLCPRCPGVESWREDSSSGPGEFKTGNFHEIFIFYEKKKKRIRQQIFIVANFFASQKEFTLKHFQIHTRENSHYVQNGI